MKASVEAPPRPRSSWRGRAAARSRTRSPSGESDCSSSAGGRAGEAVARLLSVGDDRPGEGHPYFGLMSAPDLVEACVLAGREDDARAAAAAFDGFAQPGAPDLGAGARGPVPRPALARRTRLRGRAAAARGERPPVRPRANRAALRRVPGPAGRRGSREHLRAALETFEQLGANGWADRARAALRASGEAAERGDASACRGCRRRSCRSLASSPKGSPTARSPRGSSSRRGRSTRSCATSSPRSGSRRASSSRSSGSRPRSPATCFARGSRAPVSRSCSGTCGRCAAARCRTRWRERSAIRRSWWLTGCRTRTGTSTGTAIGSSCRPPAATGRSRPSSATVSEVAALVYDAALDEDPELVEAVCAAATIALENEHLHTESQARLAELQASRQRIVAAGDAERRRLERNLHDGAQQRLVALALQLRLIQAGIRRDPSSAEALVTTASEQLAAVARGAARARARHPSGRARARSRLRAASRSRAARPCPPRCSATRRSACRSRSSSRSTSWPARHWRTSPSTPRRRRPRCGLSRAPSGVAIEIADDGVGGADETAGTGLRGLADRVEALGGSLLVTSPAGAGTVVTAELPFAS